ncbi:helix-turn-helix domain-containing protein [Mongoliibacter ruber]|uniref:DNA-binding XRE family transcriptional regulator n=1 Tax=Mongoliibacter ruber TaxID=1750599 RepID=A0A2T0WT13_9BACT|nr:helix-turn-helix transcriptional regulator [Mongoliibacter ruber]PRY89831.1 DNA-binding XRE family transcriptional regulator [Mongoliibacter ruber]
MTNIESLEKRIALADEIRKIRKANKLSQMELAEKMGIARSTISKIENGEFAFSVDYLIKLADHLNFKIKLEKNET